MLSNKLNKIVLCATANNLVAGVWHADKLQHSELFLNTAAGHEAFSTFLQGHPDTRVYLLANAVEEDYRLERLPHSTGRERKELIKRKLNQYYRGLLYRTAHFTMREKDKRKDDKFLFVALNNDDFLEQWMRIIQDLEVNLVGVYVLPMLSQLLAKQFKLSAPHILLCEKLSSGIRQTYLHNGRLRMSRLIQNVPEDEKQIGYFYLVETQKTRLYLMSKRFISREVQLNLQLVNLNDEMLAVKQSFSQEPGIECDILPLNALAQSLNLPSQSLVRMPELLHMQLLASGNLVDNFAPESQTKQYQLSKLARRIKIAAAMIGVAGLLASTWFFAQGFMHQHAFDAAKQATRLEQLKYNDVAKSFPETNINAVDLKNAIALDQKISSFAKTPKRMMLTLSHALETMPTISLHAIHWLQTNHLDIADESLTNLSATPPAHTKTVLQTNFDPTQLTEVAFVTAEVTDFDGDYRRAIRVVNEFVKKLEQAPNVATVLLLQSPVNSNSYTNLSGSTVDTQTINMKTSADFKIKVILKLPTEVVQP